MTALFLKIANMSISASWLVLAILFLRLLLKRSPKWIYVLLWGIVAVRLICPISFESAVSLVPNAETIHPEIMTDWTAQIDTGFMVLNDTVNPVITEIFAPDPVTSVNPLQILISICSAIWLAGIALLLVYTLTSYWLIRRKIRTATLLRYNVFQSEYVATPFVLGIFKPKIYLPYTLSQADIIYVISHEKAHIRRHDHWWKPLGFLLLAVHWFNPLIWLSYKLFCRDIELACDENVIQHMNNHQRAEYAQALLSCSMKPHLMTACPIAFGEVGIKTRIKSVMNYRKPTFWIILVALIACVVLAVCFLTNPKPENFSIDAAAVTQPAEIAESFQPAEVTPPTGMAQPTEADLSGREPIIDMAYFMELAVPGKTFQDMTSQKKANIIAEYGDLLDDCDMIVRESNDGHLYYIVGYYSGDMEDSPFYQLCSLTTDDENGMVQVLYPQEEAETVETAILQGGDPGSGYVIHNSYINFSPQTGYFLIHSMDSGWGFDDVFHKYLQLNGREYMLDAISRGISLGDPEGSYLEVNLISETWGEISEKIPLTQNQVNEIITQPRQTLSNGRGFMARLELGTDSAINMDSDATWYTESNGIPQSVLDLAINQCNYQFATPGDIQSNIVEARLDCEWLDEPIYASVSDLPLLQSILKNAEFGYIGACGYGAKLTIRMEDGSELVMFKGTDGCDTMAFGSYSGYFIGDVENQQFWEIFGLDLDIKQPLNG